MRSILLAISTVAIGCAGSEAMSDPDAEPIAVLDPFALTPVEAANDPMSSHRPADVDCPPAAWGPEGGGFEIQTGVCDYASFDQPLAMPAQAGDELAIIVWHDRLDAPEPATAHVAVWIGNDVLWEDQVDIPGPSGSLEAFVPIDTTPPPDARLGIHLHNHGFNSWRFVAVDLLPR